MWASEEEKCEKFHSETFSQQEYDQYQQQLSEIWAEDAWLRAAEYDPRMDDPREW
jgi:hypothetical protein